MLVILVPVQFRVRSLRFALLAVADLLAQIAAYLSTLTRETTKVTDKRVDLTNEVLFCLLCRHFALTSLARCLV